MASYSFRVLAAKSHLIILSADGTSAKAEVESEIRVVRLLKHRWTAFAGSGDVTVKSIAPGKILRLLRIVGGYRCQIVYDPPLERGRTITMRSILEYKNCFTESREWYSMNIAQPMDDLTMHIEFPPGCSISTAEAQSFYRMATE